jgi:hypothetical protein
MPNGADALEKPARLRVVLSIAAGLLAEVFTIATVGIVVLVYRFHGGASSPEALQDFIARVGTIIGPLFGAIYTFVMARWVVRKAKGRYMAHALLVAAGAIALHVAGTFGAPGGFRLIYLFADLLKLAAAAAAAFVAERQVTNRAVA